MPFLLLSANPAWLEDMDKQQFAADSIGDLPSGSSQIEGVTDIFDLLYNLIILSCDIWPNSLMWEYFFIILLFSVPQEIILHDANNLFSFNFLVASQKISYPLLLFNFPTKIIIFFFLNSLLFFF